MGLPVEPRPSHQFGNGGPSSESGHALISLLASEGKKPEDFLDFLRTLPIEALLQDRLAQATLDRIMGTHFDRNDEYMRVAREGGRLVLRNPYPVLELRSGGAIEWVHGAFMLEDDDHFYYFPTWWPGEAVPEYLRPEDVVPSGQFTPTFPHEVREELKVNLDISEQMLDYLIYCMDNLVWRDVVPLELPFNKPINRVPVSGGAAERFNAKKWEWEPNGSGVYSPGVVEQVRGEIRMLLGKKPKMVPPAISSGDSSGDLG